MIRLAKAAVDGVVHASALADAVSDQPARHCAGPDKEPGQTAWQGPCPVHCRKAGNSHQFGMQWPQCQ
jgi:hypothetical protein